jgi:hypothetical protein
LFACLFCLSPEGKIVKIATRAPLRDITTRRCGGLVVFGDETSPGVNAGDALPTRSQAVGARGQQGLGGRELTEPAKESKAWNKTSALRRHVMLLPLMD